MSKKANKGGRPSVYETRIKPYMRYIAQMRIDGYTHDDIAKFLRVGNATYYKHKAEIEGFSDTLKDSEEDLVEQIEASMYQLALGKVKTTDVTVEYDADGNVSGKREVVKEHKPDRVSQFFALTNLKGDKWKHKQDFTFAQYDDEVDSFADALKDKHDES